MNGDMLSQIFLALHCLPKVAKNDQKKEKFYFCVNYYTASVNSASNTLMTLFLRLFHSVLFKNDSVLVFEKALIISEEIPKIINETLHRACWSWWCYKSHVNSLRIFLPTTIRKDRK